MLKNKNKGYTLIELLAVIVILAIIALIAIPTILNMIEDAKKNATVDSSYGYIESIELYQAVHTLKNGNTLPEGRYNVASETIIGDKRYQSFNNLVDIKGTKPTGGTVDILKNGMIGSAVLCIDNHLIDYTGGVSKVTSNDCGDMNLVIGFTIDSFKWEKSKTLTITYPKGDYEYYYQVDSGKVSQGETTVENGKEIKVTNNVVKLKIEENSSISAWMLKKGNKISLKEYEENKIDNVELETPVITDLSSIPIIYSTGLEMKKAIGIDFEKQKGTSAYYSLDDGKTWKKYTKEITEDATKIKAKLVREQSKRESEIVEIEIDTNNTTADSTIYPNVFDGNESTYVGGGQLTNKNVYFRISDEMQNKKIKIKWRDNNSTDTIYHVFLDENKQEIPNTKVTLPNLKTVTEEYYIPENAKYILFYVGYSCEVYELSPINFFVDFIEEKTSYPIITSNGIQNGNISVKIINSHPVKYKIDDGEYKNYNGGSIDLKPGENIYAEVTNDKTGEVKTAEYTAVSPTNAIGANAYDDDPTQTTFFSATNKTTYYILIDKGVWGKKLNIKSKGYQSVAFYDAIGGNLVKNVGSFRTTTNTIEIPNDAYVMYYYFNESGGIYNITISD